MQDKCVEAVSDVLYKMNEVKLEVYLCGVALTRALDSFIGNHMTRFRSVRIVANDIHAVFLRSWSPWIQRLRAVRCSRGVIYVDVFKHVTTDAQIMNITAQSLRSLAEISDTNEETFNALDLAARW
ncbi:unnamed protein product, partial [Timema podura]|nr:unnamed protein product [Timema podura]